MATAKESLENIVKKMGGNKKVEDLFTTNVAGKDVPWDMDFFFTLEGEDPFYLIIKDNKAEIGEGGLLDARIVLEGDPNAIIRICEGKGDFTHAISREEITVAEGKVMDVIRLTKAITIVLQKK